jgi:hypothetical protein
MFVVFCCRGAGKPERACGICLRPAVDTGIGLTMRLSSHQFIRRSRLPTGCEVEDRVVSRSR